MTQRAITANELADVITTWDTNDECSDEEEYGDASGGRESPNEHVSDSDECPDNCEDESDEDDNVSSIGWLIWRQLRRCCGGAGGDDGLEP